MRLQIDNESRKAQADAIADRIAAKLAERNKAFRRKHPRHDGAFNPLNSGTKKLFAAHVLNILTKQEKNIQEKAVSSLSFFTSKIKYLSYSFWGGMGYRSHDSSELVKARLQDDKYYLLYDESVIGSTFALELKHSEDLREKQRTEDNLKNSYLAENRDATYAGPN